MIKSSSEYYYIKLPSSGLMLRMGGNGETCELGERRHPVSSLCPGSPSAGQRHWDHQLPHKHMVPCAQGSELRTPGTTESYSFVSG